MEQQEAEPLTLQNQPVYTVDSLIERMGVKANGTLWGSIESVIRVQGIVGKVKPYGNVVYFDLGGSECKLTIKCDRSLSPNEGERIVVEGMPSFKPSKFSLGLDIVVSGFPVGQIALKETGVKTALPNLEKGRYLRLYDYLQDHDISGLHILGTQTAIRDVLSHLDTPIAGFVSHETVRVSDKGDIFKKISNIPQEATAIAIVRGGDDATMGIWNDRDIIEALLELEIPFYLALGHTHGISLASRYADETFHTPSAFGISLGSIMRQILQEKRIAIRAEEFTKKENMFLEREQAFLAQQEQYQESKALFMSNENGLKEKELLLLKSAENKEAELKKKIRSQQLIIGLLILILVLVFYFFF